MNIGLLASGELGYNTIKHCEKLFTPAFIATDKRSTALIDYANVNSIPLFIGVPRSGKLYNFIKDFSIDVILSINYLYIIEEDIIRNVNHAINFHGSLLPKYRGRTPHVWSIINNEKFTGITAHLIDVECDTGAIILQEEIPIDSEETGGDLLGKFFDLYPILVEKIFTMLKNNELTVVEQDHQKASYFEKRTPEDGLIDWNWQKERIKNWVRAQAFPYPGAFTYLSGQKITIDKIGITEMGFSSSMPNGLILETKPNPLIKTANGVIEILTMRDNNYKLIKGEIFEHENKGF